MTSALFQYHRSIAMVKSSLFNINENYIFLELSSAYLICSVEIGSDNSELRAV